MEMQPKIHHGRNLKRFREMLGVKQEALAFDLGDDWSQKKVSRLEEKEVIEDDILDQVAAVLKVPVQAFKNFNDDSAITYINTFNDSSFSQAQGTNFNPYNCVFNPIEKLVEAMDENKKLYEKLLQAEKEKVVLLEKMLASAGGK
jgi:transcriptional regulator with XRE-family HTH domain